MGDPVKDGNYRGRQEMTPADRSPMVQSPDRPYPGPLKHGNADTPVTRLHHARSAADEALALT